MLRRRPKGSREIHPQTKGEQRQGLREEEGQDVLARAYLALDSTGLSAAAFGW